MRARVELSHDTDMHPTEALYAATVGARPTQLWPPVDRAVRVARSGDRCRRYRLSRLAAADGGGVAGLSCAHQVESDIRAETSHFPDSEACEYTPTAELDIQA